MASDQETTQQSAKEDRKKRRKRRWGAAAPEAAAPEAATPSPAPAAPLDARAKALALQASIRAKLAAIKNKQQPATAATANASSLPAKRAADSSSVAPSASKKARHFDIDFSETAPTFQKEQEQAVANLKNKQPQKKVNPYLSSAATTAAITTEGEEHDEEPHDEQVDDRLVRASKPRARHKAMKFVEPGTFVEIAQRKRQKALNAAASGFTSGRKTGNYVTQATMAQVYGGGGSGVEGSEDQSFLHPSLLPERAEHRYEHIPLVMEWWDTELLPKKLKASVAQHEGKALSEQAQAQLQQLGSSDTKKSEKSDAANKSSEKENGSDEKHDDNNQDKKMPAKPSATQLQELRTTCFEQASLSYSKTAALVQHIVPMKPPHVNEEDEANKKKKPVLHLTKRELKRQRKLRREAKQRELQDRQAAGLEPPPEPRLTLKNFMRVLGDQAYLDPSKMEQTVMEQIQARQRAHLERNEANKLTKEQRAAKKQQKLQQDASQGVTKVALFFVQDMSHPYHRAKVDLNAQQNMITGGVLECENPSLACVICEGGPKAIQRYKRLMLVRMKWTGTGEDDDDDDDDDEEEGGEDAAPTHKFNKDNRCALVWEGFVVKRLFPNFVFQSCETSAQARKVLKAKGVEHYWDQVIEHARGAKKGFQLKLVDSDDDDEGEATNATSAEAMDES